MSFSAAARAADLPDSLKLPQDLHEGDLLVHEDHGLCRFEGLETVSGAETIRVVFAGDDALLVPLHDAGRLWRHGHDEGDLALDHLSGTAWKKRRGALRRRIARIAARVVAQARRRAETAVPVLPATNAVLSAVTESFAWDETPDQQGAIAAVLADLASGRAMDRLLVGDVGFGKTEVALRAMAAAAGAGVQVALLAPTTVLAHQHLATLTRRFAGTGIAVASLSRLDTARDARRTRAGLRDASVRVVVGTHAILGRATGFANLGLVVVDEEQRFGKVHKRLLRKLAQGVHILSMTATPIPGSLQQAMVGLQDISVLGTAPRGRLAVETLRAPLSDAALREALILERDRGGRSFVVVPRIEQIAQAARRIAAACPDLTLGQVHGDLPGDVLQARMTAFAAGEVDVLLATTLIESGLDVPGANTMVVLHPSMFGLTQLHQLRGRIGRGRVRARCLLLHEATQAPSPAARRRLDALARDAAPGAGFRLSRIDLDRRGGGDPLGDAQTGHDARIGPALHADLMVSALRRATGRPARTRPALHLEAAAGLPADYIRVPDVRATLYNRIGHIRSAKEATDMAAEIEERFGPLPPAARTLLALAQLRGRAGEKGIRALMAGPKAVVVHRGAGGRIVRRGPFDGLPAQLAALCDLVDEVQDTGPAGATATPSGRRATPEGPDDVAPQAVTGAAMPPAPPGAHRPRP
jgi:transcription-repair coupling factor (superfamily II helicase)